MATSAARDGTAAATGRHGQWHDEQVVHANPREQVMKFVLIPVVVATFVVIAAITLYAGVFNVAADDPHWGATRSLLEAVRERSIAVRASGIQVPPLDDPKLIALGAGHYSEMCTGCHLAPGMEETEIRAGLYPKPPSLVEQGAHESPEKQFWIIKHGIKMTGMPAWGATHDDQAIWGMVAFLRKLPRLSPQQYHELTEQGDEGQDAHHHDHGDHDAHDEGVESAPPEGSVPAGARSAAGKVAAA
jgi:mono/diheme cytochrome c family protein